MMDAPPSASATAMARPILRPAPVTIATLPLSSLILILSTSCPVLCRASTPFFSRRDVDGRDKAGHDELTSQCSQIDAAPIQHHQQLLRFLALRVRPAPLLR